MAVMVNGGDAGGGGWVDITDSVTLGSGKGFRYVQSNSDARVEDNANGAYVLIEDIAYKDRYRITGWINGSSTQRYNKVIAAVLDENDTVLAASARDTIGSETSYDAYGEGVNTNHSSTFTPLYAPIEVTIPKLPGVVKLMVFHCAIMVGSTYDDVIVEKWIG